MQESITINIAVYIIMLIFSIVLVSYAVYLSYKIVTKGSRQDARFEDIYTGWAILGKLD